MSDWKKMTEEQKDRRREASRRYRMTERAKALQYERRKRWNEKNADKKRANDRAWYARKKMDDVWMANRVARIETWRVNNKERYMDYMIGYRRGLRFLYARDSSAYARSRAAKRAWKRMKAESEGRDYKPRLSCRIPDWCRKGECKRIASRSVFLRENLCGGRLREIDGYARELAIERMGCR